MAQGGEHPPAQSRGYTYDYPRPAVTVDIVLFAIHQGALQVLLVQRKHAPFAGAWALPGGFVEMDEDLETAALRELREETSVRDVYVEQLHTFGAPDRDPRGRVITVAYFALLSEDERARVRLRSASDASEAAWWSVRELPELAFDHDRILEHALRRLRSKLESTALGFLLLPDEFTPSELEDAYESVLGEPLDKRSLLRKLLAAGVLEESGQLGEGGAHTAKLYRFSAAAIELERARRHFP